MSSNDNLTGRSGSEGGAAGFSLIEVMVALIVLSVGLLGIARMQSLALSSTSIANKRSLAAIEAASLAATMHENRGYWTSSDPASGTISIAGTTLSYSGGLPLLSVAGNPSCTVAATPCTPVNIAAYDLNKWAADLKTLLPSDQATIVCGAVSPVSCTITITWAENAVGINAQESAAAATATSALQLPSYTLYVQP